MDESFLRYCYIQSWWLTLYQLTTVPRIQHVKILLFAFKGSRKYTLNLVFYDL